MDYKERIKEIPDSSGVYIFKDSRRKIIYIGKAISLRKRIRSHFAVRAGSSAKAQLMIKKVESIDYIETPSEIEALLLEANLIKEHKPKYNISLRDDKSFPFLKLTAGEKFPRLFVTRKKINDGSIYFGPYTDAKLLRKAAWFLKKIFRLRTCRQLPKTVCLEYHLNQCMGPCEAIVTEKEYKESVKQLEMFLLGKGKNLIKMLRRKMDKASEAQRYEEAALYRDRLSALTSLAQRKNVLRGGIIECIDELTELRSILSLDKMPRKIEAFDISNISGTLSVGSTVTFHDGKPQKTGYRRFKIKTVSGVDDYNMMREVVSRRYGRIVKEGAALPDVILIDGGRGHVNAAAQMLEKLGITDVPVMGIAKPFDELHIKGRQIPLRLKPRSRALKLLQRMRDEAHRFAQDYHFRLRDKAMLESVLDEIEGVGGFRKQELLKFFDSVDDIKKADVKVLKQVEGIGPKTAKGIKEFFNARG